MYEDITYEVDGPAAVLTMNRPASLNAFTNLMLAEIRHALGTAEQDPNVVGIVLTGAGRGFCAGMDMNALSEMTGGARGKPDYDHLACDPGNPDKDPNFETTLTYLLGIRKPLLAAVNGAAAGMGLCYALYCDMRFMERAAKLTTSFSQRGLVAEHGASWMLPRLIGPSRALDLLWTSKRLDGEEAHRLGLADRLCEAGESVAEAKAYIGELAASAAPTSLMHMKSQVYKHLNSELGPAMVETNALMEASLDRSDFGEGVRSFMEKRPPRFAPLKVE